MNLYRSPRVWSDIAQHRLLMEQLNLTGGLINQRAERGRGPNSIVEPDPARNFLHIRTDLLAQIGYFVDEGDLGGQECVRCVLRALSGGVESGIPNCV
jgi:hypothetical protein